ncbi:DUF2637 domain-containing protein [Streptomyces sp. TRM66268-LWL]|uniref:DUF2637 domain-containing protein n=1 Tax=Streptomyces polyasparticus TaxID=2767826 RepID=A0ABR7SWV8_9ACTN|nr:DUF2637 domain-containing protein [Streptomyces polyasparticus]MBC9719369.1 DUF2637 domain-containing protein [Streptomyces polyasparticus]
MGPLGFPHGDSSRAPRFPASDEWLRRLCALLVAGVAAYASYVHQREFALQGGADRVSAALWPLSVDGLLLLSTVGLLRPPREGGRGRRLLVWAAFCLGIAVSLAANIAAAPTLAWQPVLVAGWPPVALLLSVELLVLGRGRASLEALDAVEEEHGEPGPEGELLTSALAADARHRSLHQRPISAETLRKELRVGAKRARQLVMQVRARSDGEGRVPPSA